MEHIFAGAEVCEGQRAGFHGKSHPFVREPFEHIHETVPAGFGILVGCQEDGNDLVVVGQVDDTCLVDVSGEEFIHNTDTGEEYVAGCAVMLYRVGVENVNTVDATRNDASVRETRHGTLVEFGIQQTDGFTIGNDLVIPRGGNVAAAFFHMPGHGHLLDGALCGNPNHVVLVFGDAQTLGNRADKYVHRMMPFFIDTDTAVGYNPKQAAGVIHHLIDTFQVGWQCSGIVVSAGQHMLNLQVGVFSRCDVKKSHAD